MTQALDRRSGAVFYLDVNYGDNKGGVTSGQNMISSVTGQNQTQAGREYAAQRIYGEVLSTATNPAVSGFLVGLPVIAGSVVITNGVETFTDNGTGSLVSSLSGGNTGGIVYATGDYDVTFKSANTFGNPITANYQYFYQESTNYGTAPFASGGVPQVNINVASSVITAEDFPLRANFTLGAARVLNQLQDKVREFGGRLNLN